MIVCNLQNHFNTKIFIPHPTFQHPAPMQNKKFSTAFSQFTVYGLRLEFIGRLEEQPVETWNLKPETWNLKLETWILNLAAWPEEMACELDEQTSFLVAALKILKITPLLQHTSTPLHQYTPTPLCHYFFDCSSIQIEEQSKNGGWW